MNSFEELPTAIVAQNSAASEIPSLVVSRWQSDSGEGTASAQRLEPEGF